MLFLSVRSLVPGVQLVSAAARKTLSSPLHTGLRDQTSLRVDGWMSSERREELFFEPARKGKPVSKYAVVVVVVLLVLVLLLLNANLRS